MVKNRKNQRSSSVKIGIIGPKHVGKTALANLLNGHLKSLGISADLVHESARRCPLPINKKTTIGAAYWLLGAQIAAEALVQETRQFAICDRTVIDIYPFLFLALNRKTNSTRTNVFTQELVSLKNLIKEYITARPYQFLFYVPIRQELWNIYSPPDDLPFQLLVDKEFREILSELQINFFELTSIDSYQRLKEIMSILEKSTVLKTDREVS